MKKNPVLSKLPEHLLNLTVDQHYENYTAQDHALWRFVMRQNTHYLSKVAHSSYLDGLKTTGINLEKIPDTAEMNEKLGKIGWATVAVDGFIPPSAFMEFQAWNVLVIAADIRPMDQIGYTPAPDIIHEAAGHAPIIADPEYAEYLRRFGEIGSKAFQSDYDNKMYEAIRHLSILKADPYTPQAEIDMAMHDLSELEKQSVELSEMAQIRNLHWWTVEYGLIGNMDQPRIYGAGLLSSIAESYSCLHDSVKKLPYTHETAKVTFDITTQQPQLFVTPDFKHLNIVLEEFANTMALRRGGIEGLRKAIDSASTATVVLSSGLQVSGTLVTAEELQGQPVYMRFAGPVALAYAGTELGGHGKDWHQEGYSTALGYLRDPTEALEDCSESQLCEMGIEPGKSVELEFASGIRVQGLLKSILRREDKNILMSFEKATVMQGERVLFRPEWGVFDLALGVEVVSVFPGPADAKAFGLVYPIPAEKTHKIQHSAAAQRLFKHYQLVRDVREGQRAVEELQGLWLELDGSFPAEWLIRIEMLEILIRHPETQMLQNEISLSLQKIKLNQPDLSKWIDDGLALIC